MKNSKIITIALILLFGITCFSTSAIAVSAESGEFIVLGREENGELVEEKVTLSVEPGVTTEIQARLSSGIEMLVLDKREVKGTTYYILSTFGREGGIIGWVSEEYIYEIVPQE